MTEPNIDRNHPALSRPALIVISGSPGSGKTTLAGPSREPHYPLLQRDALKEVLLDSLGAADRPASRRLGARPGRCSGR